jgi:hypothetical protein
MHHCVSIRYSCAYVLQAVPETESDLRDLNHKTQCGTDDWSSRVARPDRAVMTADGTRTVAKMLLLVSYRITADLARSKTKHRNE